MAIARMILWVFALLLTSTASSASNRLPTGDLSKSNLEKWEEKIFSKSTSYSLVSLQDTTVLKAVSQKSASGLFKKIKVDLGKYPYLNWSWRIENRLNTTDEKTKSGDDYAARVYVVVEGGILLWKTKAVNYVWANRAEKYEVWPNAFAGKSAMMMALRNSKDKTANWYHEKRNVFDDLKKLFGQEFKSIDVVAIMTDTDNDNGQVTAYYGDIYFSTN
jgi:hypothetical protein